MTKKEKLAYFKLVEPKLYEKYTAQNLKESDFEALNIKGKDIELFYEKYLDLWIEKEFESEFTENAEFWDAITDDDIFGLEFPDDKFFYQLGVSNLNIEALKTELELKTRILYINKVTGGIETPDQIELNHFPDDKNIQNRIKLVIEDPIVFLEQLKNGDIDKILANDKKNPTQWEVPQNHPMSKALTILEVDKLIDVLADNKIWILHQGRLHLSNGSEVYVKDFKSFVDYQKVKEYEEMFFSDGTNKECDKKTLESRFFFKVENPSKMRAELLKGNMKILDEIKNINFSSNIFTNKNEG